MWEGRLSDWILALRVSISSRGLGEKAGGGGGRHFQTHWMRLALP